MGLDHLLLLAAIQGITEFIPVSSSGHLQLVHGLTAFPDHGLAVDVALHAGTLLAVMAYFYRDVGLILVGARDIVRRQPSAPATLVWVLMIASLPVLLAGAILVVLGVTDALRKPEIVAWASIVFAIPLWLADRKHATRSSDIKASERGDVQTISPRHALIIGLAQMLALIPGASRAGVTIMAGLYLGFDRTQAARFSMVLAMPVIGAFALVGLVDLVQASALEALGMALVAGLLAALFAFATIHMFLKITRKIGLLPFVIYRIGLGIGLLVALA
ncbi:MAG: undecaprenyl-diphosphate phosphatase [Pseudomonadota bacterium]|nr:undecaprenyl-diphosphate phosphatase [Pseudomonadota bacterium]